MNQHYEIDPASPSCGRLRREHPELLIGRPGEEIPQETIDWGIRTGLNYAFPQVRAHMAAISIELVERFDVDGIELDFMRHPGVFRPEQGYANRHLLTDMVRSLRRRMEEIGRQKGRKLELAVRVASTLYDSERLGMEAERWIKEGMVDLVVTGLGFRPFEAKVAEFVEAAAGTDCQILGCFEALRPVVQTEVLRGMAARYLDAGADGIYFFNFYSMSSEWKTRTVGELIDRDALARLDKVYEIDAGGPPPVESQIGHAFRHCMPLEQLPVRLEETRAQSAVELTFEIADDLEGAAAAGELKECVLGLGFAELAEGDEVAVSVNGTALDWAARRVPPEPWTQEVYGGPQNNWNLYPSQTTAVPLDVSPVEFSLDAAALRRGPNQLDIRLVSRADGASGALVLQLVRILVRYA